jgi:hypothetical protein
MFGMGIWGTFGRYTAESFPTRIRGTGTSALVEQKLLKDRLSFLFYIYIK